ncbi:hypothetical protein ACMHYQ_13210 [Ectopseudomonas guguanensis]|uniref:hypothetical protein n=1 Tax=Ectopseudomonas guguanensis TaxID=1198456 RepID=UPI0039C3EC80
MPRPARRKLFYRDGLCRIENLRYLVQVDSSNESKENLRIQVVIREVLEDGGRRQPSTQPSETILVPIGDLPSLWRNRLFRDGYPLKKRYKLKAEQEECLTLDLSPENLTFFKRFDEDSSGPIIRKSKHNSQEDSETLYVGIGYNGDPYGVIIPSVDIFVFFYANSTFMTQLVLSESILDPGFSVYDTERSIKSGRNRKIWLKPDVPESNALHLVMLLFDDYALEAAQRIYTDRGPGGQKSKYWPIRATPPIKGEVKLDLIGRYEGSRYIVTQITSCDWSPPFDHVEWERDRRPINSTKATAEPGPTRSWVVIDSPDEVSDGKADERKARSEVEEPDLDSRFPGLQKVSLARSPRLEPQEKEGVRYLKTKIPIKKASTALGGDGPIDERRAEIKGQEQPPPNTPKQALENVQIDAEDVQDQSISTTRLLLAARKHRLAKVNFLNPGFASTIFSNGLDKESLCLLPSRIDGKDKAWLFSDEGKRRQRVAVIAKVEFQGKVRYIVELQMRRDHRISTGLIWRESNSEIQEGILHELALLFADPSASESLKRSTTRYNLQLGRCRHDHKTKIDWGNPEQFAEDFLNRLFKPPQSKALATGDNQS